MIFSNYFFHLSDDLNDLSLDLEEAEFIKNNYIGNYIDIYLISIFDMNGERRLRR